MKPIRFSNCKKCNGNLIADRLEIDEAVWRIVRCEKCGWEYQEVFVFSHNETCDDCNILNNNGEISDLNEMEIKED